MAKLAVSAIALVLAVYIGSTEGLSCSSFPRYVYRADEMTFNDAKKVCSDMGARLAVANTYEEAVLISNLAQHSQVDFKYTFVGRFYDGRFWFTVDGSLVADSGYVGWMESAPGYSEHTKGTYEACGVIGWNALHDDQLCDSQYPFICEFYNKPCTNP